LTTEGGRREGGMGKKALYAHFVELKVVQDDNLKREVHRTREVMKIS